MPARLASVFVVLLCAGTAAASSRTAREDCAVIVAVARDSLSWGRPGTEPVWLTDISGYKPACAWSAAGLPRPNNPEGRMMAVWRPRFGPEPDMARLGISYYSHYGQSDYVCEARRRDGRWFGQAPCRPLSDTIVPLPPGRGERASKEPTPR